MTALCMESFARWKLQFRWFTSMFHLRTDVRIAVFIFHVEYMIGYIQSHRWLQPSRTGSTCDERVHMARTEMNWAGRRSSQQVHFTSARASGGSRGKRSCHGGSRGKRPHPPSTGMTYLSRKERSTQLPRTTQIYPILLFSETPKTRHMIQLLGTSSLRLPTVGFALDPTWGLSPP